MLPSRNRACRLIAGFSLSLIPSGEYGIAAARSPSAASRSSAASREIFSGFTRRSSGAFCSRPLASASSALYRGEPLGLVAAQPGVELAQVRAEERDPGRERKTPRALRRRDALEKAPAPERRVHRIGDHGAVAPADLGMAAEKRRERRIGGLFERQHGRKGRRARIQQRARKAHHLPMRVTTWSERVPSESTTRTRTGRKSRSAANQMSVALSSGPSRNFAMCSVCISPAGVVSFSVPTTVKRNGVNPRPSARVTSYSLPF